MVERSGRVLTANMSNISNDTKLTSGQTKPPKGTTFFERVSIFFRTSNRAISWREFLQTHWTKV